MKTPKIPHNSLVEEITEIVSLCEQLQPEYGENALWFLPPELNEEITKWERDNGINIPLSYKEWLELSSGSQIINSTANFFALEDIGIYNYYVPDDYIVIGELIDDGELLCFSKTTGKFIRYNHGKSIEYKNFNDVLNFILNII